MYKVLKRLEDIFIATIVLLLASPIMLIVGVCLYFSGIRSVFFLQKRAGLNGKAFYIYKFKTMTDERDANGELLPDEQRSTKIGKFLRKTSLDELPQMLNVMKGDMSIVGPRPLLMEYNNMYSPKHKTRLNVIPGITGYSAVNGRSGLTFGQRFDLDAEYVQKASFALDNLIIFKTFSAVFFAKGSPAVPNDNIDDLGFIAKYREIMHRRNEMLKLTDSQKMSELLKIINKIRANKNASPLDNVSDSTKLGADLDFDSFDLAELTVNIEDVFGVDVFESGIVKTVGEIREKLAKNGK